MAWWFSTDTKLKVTGINPAARRLLDLEFTESATLHCVDMLPDPQVCDLIRKTVETGTQPYVPDEQRIIVLPEGDGSKHYLFSVTAIRGSDRNLSGIVLLLRDVTRLKEVERLKNEFVMAASHELRTPSYQPGHERRPSAGTRRPGTRRKKTRTFSRPHMRKSTA